MTRLTDADLADLLRRNPDVTLADSARPAPPRPTPAQPAKPAHAAPVPAAQSVILPLPPSVNHYLVSTGRGGRALTEEARNWIAAADIAIMHAHLVCYAGPVAVTLHVYRERKIGDLDNRVKLTLDSLNGHAWGDDAQVVELHAYRHDDAANPRVEVEIRTVQQESCP